MERSLKPDLKLIAEPTVFLIATVLLIFGDEESITRCEEKV